MAVLDVTMAVAVCGSHCTGKSTLIDDLQRSLAGETLITVSNVTRTLIAEGYSLGKEADVRSLNAYLARQVQHELAAIAEHPRFLISDRCTLDTLGYVDANEELLGVKYPKDFLELLEAVVLLEQRIFGLYVFCPVEFSMIPDGIRYEDEAYRSAVGNRILAHLDRLQFPYVIASGNPESRLNLVTDQIKNQEQAAL